ncbi:MAG: extensin family protein [Gammaproteobacteria bacterium]|nr:extensin family protein [Gammaproteobacteria bacterium]MBU1443084.1 extensin family protein [Gammaproteobacteria bacterium]MBU2410390.1 extensin family protein [Gammaproteobacteria bacterium]
MLVAAALAVGGWKLHTGEWQIPDRLNPWAPLDVAEAPGFLTAYKLQHARGDPARCLAALDASGVDQSPVPDRVTGEGCGFRNAVRLRAGQSALLVSPVVLSCPAALSFAMWERHILDAAAARHFGDGRVTIEHLGSYACRNVNTGEGASAAGRRSRHATADALDISGFRIRGGARITVARNWPGSDAESLFLREVHDGACRYFDGVLGPDYNAVHADHLHLEVGGWNTCR